MDYLERIRQARVYDVAERTPLQRAPQLSERLGCEVWLKREDQQRTFSFKLRGAYNKISGLDEQQRARGRNRRFGRQSCPGRGVGGLQAEPGCRDRDAADHAADQGQCRACLGRQHRAGRGRLRCGEPSMPWTRRKPNSGSSCIRTTTRTSSRGREPSRSKSASNARPCRMRCSSRLAAVDCWPGWEFGCTMRHRTRA